MGEYFDDIHASCETELRGLPSGIADSPEVAAARASADYDGYIKLGGALSRQLRYREAAQAYSMAVAASPQEPSALRLRAGRYLSTLQTEKAYADFGRCLEMGADRLDAVYRLGLCCYFMGRYSEAMTHFEAALPLADDEMGIALLYWHTLSAYRCGKAPNALAHYRIGMDVGHHFAYEKAVAVCAGACALSDMRSELEKMTDDLHYTITAYGLSLYLRNTGEEILGRELLENVLTRNAFWPCFAYLAAWNDENAR